MVQTQLERADGRQYPQGWSPFEECLCICTNDISVSSESQTSLVLHLHDASEPELPFLSSSLTRCFRCFSSLGVDCLAMVLKHV